MSQPEETPLEQKAQKVRKNWFGSLPGGEQDAIIKPHFEKQFPTNQEKREATEKYGKSS